MERGLVDSALVVLGLGREGLVTFPALFVSVVSPTGAGTEIRHAWRI